jgi:hypothetical protein
MIGFNTRIEETAQLLRKLFDGGEGTTKYAEAAKRKAKLLFKDKSYKSVDNFDQNQALSRTSRLS